MSNACKSYRCGKTTCADGFIQLAPCWQGIKPPLGGKFGEKPYLPWCLRELPSHMAKDDGSPLFYQVEVING